jgi:uncharacterized protein Usg
VKQKLEEKDTFVNIFIAERITKKLNIFGLNSCDQLDQTAWHPGWTTSDPATLEHHFSDKLILKHPNVFLHISHEFSFPSKILQFLLFVQESATPNMSTIHSNLKFWKNLNQNRHSTKFKHKQTGI